MARVATVRPTKNGAHKISNKPASNLNEEISKLAYQFYLDRGGEHGHDVEDWAQAEAIIRKRKS